jgi:hypothetical protein
VARNPAVPCAVARTSGLVLGRVSFRAANANAVIAAPQADPSLGLSPSPLWRGAVNRRVWPQSRSGRSPLGAPVAPSQRGSLSGDFEQDCAPHPASESPASASLSPAVGPPRSRSVRGRQLLTEGVVQFAAADLALEHLVTAVVVLPLLGVDEAGSPLRREELNAC